MKIAFVMPWHISERGGGAEVQANYLAQELVLRGYEVSYICQTIVESKIGSFETINGFQIYWLKSSGRFAWRDQNKYFNALVKLHPDIVLQRLSSNVTYPIGKYCNEKNVSFHWFCTDNDSPFWNFHIKSFTKRYKLNFKNSLKYTLFYLNALLMDYYRNKGMKLVDVAWTQNNFQKQQVLQNFKLKSFTMISGHPVPKFTRNLNKRFNDKIVLWCGNLGIHKRPELFLELAEKMQHTEFEFVMIGGHSNRHYVDDLFKNKPDNVEYLGKLSFDDALAYFDQASILINTSVAEGFSNTYIQAWLRGVPTLVLGADPNLVIANHDLGYNCLDLTQVEEKLQLLFQNKENFISQGKHIKEYAEQHHSIKVMTNNFIKHLNQ